MIAVETLPSGSELSSTSLSGQQRRIVAELDALQAAELEALLPSILDRAFKGEL
jgi:hypothetical protein